MIRPSGPLCKKYRFSPCTGRGVIMDCVVAHNADTFSFIVVNHDRSHATVCQYCVLSVPPPSPIPHFCFHTGVWLLVSKNQSQLQMLVSVKPQQHPLLFLCDNNAIVPAGPLVVFVVCTLFNIVVAVRVSFASIFGMPVPCTPLRPLRRASRYLLTSKTRRYSLSQLYSSNEAS